jgi:hypothetical protein
VDGNDREGHLGEGGTSIFVHGIGFLGRQPINDRIHQRHEIFLLQGIDGEWDTKVFAWKMSQLSWESLLRNHDLLVGALYGSELALVDIGAEATYLWECVHDGSNNGEIYLWRRNKNDQVIRIQGEPVANGWSSKKGEQPTSVS